MKKLLINYGGILLFYIIVIFGVLFLCSNNMHQNVNDKNFNISSISNK